MPHLLLDLCHSVPLFEMHFKYQAITAKLHQDQRTKKERLAPLGGNDRSYFDLVNTIFLSNERDSLADRRSRGEWWHVHLYLGLQIHCTYTATQV